jgi:Fic family protein/predicted transcriptional regulator
MKESRQEINRQKDVIESVLRGFKAGALIDEVKKATGLNINVRTLQRRLEDMIKQGVIRRTGQSHSTRYHLAEKESPEVIPATESDSDFIPLTDESRKVLSLVKRPEQAREPVSYNRNFLESYQPNISSYLTEEEKKKLAEFGQTPDLNQPAGTYVKEILNRLLIDLSWNSSRLEGNTYSLLDTERLISLGQAADGKSTTDAQMILNHKEAIEFMVQDVNDIGLNRYTILNLHAILSNNLLPDPMASGRLRTIIVGIQKSVYTPLAIPQLVEEMFDLILAKAAAIENPFEQAFFIMVHLPYLQPFDDVNKRVSRLAANIPLNRHNLAPLSFIDVPNDIYIQGLIGVYEMNRIELLKDVFLWAYERSSRRYASVQQSLGKPDLFRLKYRNNIRELITNIISNSLTHKEAAPLINNKAASLPEKDQAKFIEAVETELMSLHEGNFARYLISPSQFKRWKEAWDKN